VDECTKIPSDLGGWGMCPQESVAVESREAALGYGARSTSTCLSTSSRPKGGSTIPSQRRIVATRGAARSSGGVCPRIRRRQRPCTEGFAIISAPPPPFWNLDRAMVTIPYPTITHYRLAHLILESAGPSRRGGSHSKQGCSTDARSVGEGYGRWLIFQRVTRVHDRKCRRNGRNNFSTRRQER
jgi:hypothetical protein